MAVCVCERDRGSGEEWLLYSLPCRAQRVKCDQQQTSAVIGLYCVMLTQNPVIYGCLKAWRVMYPIGKIKLHSATESDKHCIHKTSPIQRVKILAALLCFLTLKGRQHLTCLLCMFLMRTERRIYIPCVHMPDCAKA